MIRISLILFVSVIMLGCSKKAGKYNPDFIGTWRTEGYTINTTTVYKNEIIIKESDGAYRLQCSDVCEPYLCDCANEVTGTPLVNDERTLLKIGSTNSIALSIDEEPYQNTAGEWEMKIDGKVYIKE